MNGPNFTWPLLLFASALPERLMAKMGKIYRGRPLQVKSRKELLATIKTAALEIPAARTTAISPRAGKRRRRGSRA